MTNDFTEDFRSYLQSLGWQCAEQTARSWLYERPGYETESVSGTWCSPTRLEISAPISWLAQYRTSFTDLNEAESWLRQFLLASKTI